MTNNHITIGILAHVDAGKTTLSEAMLYSTGKIRSLGRVDHQDAYLDNDAQERERGITIFSKQARLDISRGTNAADTARTADKARTWHVVMLDTPGHVDFSAEMERTLQVLDYAILVISATDGVQGHTRTLWRLLKHYNVPTFIFVNKMDMQGTDEEKVQAELPGDRRFIPRTTATDATRATVRRRSSVRAIPSRPRRADSCRRAGTGTACRARYILFCLFADAR